MKAQQRWFDLAGALLGLLLLSPLMLAIAIAVTVPDGGPVFFRQVRTGRRGRPFRIWKFRTMTRCAEESANQLTVGEDARITAVGSWLRRLKLDELPQLFNVVAGQMSLVGPRPEVPRYVAYYTAAERRVLDVLPGLTDEASLRFRDESERLAGVADPESYYIAAIMPEKIRISLAYAERATLWSDARMIVATVCSLLGGSAAVATDAPVIAPRRCTRS
jgi:lipopolysaccharide/colanic/teichoic acid biosynthesis glycosyltransferase